MEDLTALYSRIPSRIGYKVQAGGGIPITGAVPCAGGVPLCRRPYRYPYQSSLWDRIYVILCVLYEMDKTTPGLRLAAQRLHILCGIQDRNLFFSTESLVKDASKRNAFKEEIKSMIDKLRLIGETTDGDKQVLLDLLEMVP